MTPAIAKRADALRPFYDRWHGGEDARHIAASLEAERRAAIIEQIELHIAAALDQLFFALCLAPRLVHAARHQSRVDVREL